MPSTPLAPPEDAHLAALRSLGLSDTTPVPALDAIVQAAAEVCGTPIALLTVLDEQRQWFKSSVGLPGITDTPREDTFCAHAILGSGTMEVPDATQDARFRDNPFVQQAPHVRFYAGAPIVLQGGHALGTLCVIDCVPRALNQAQHAALSSLARSAAAIMQQAGGPQTAPEGRPTRREDRRLTRLYETTPAMLHTLDAQGHLLAVSDTWLSRLGYTREEVIGRRLMDFLTEDSQAHARAVLPMFLSTGRCRDIAYQMVTKDGAILDVLLSALLDCDSDGAPSRSVAVIEDVTQRLRVEQGLAQERRRLSSLIDGIGAAIWDLNVQTGALRVNHRWREALGLTPEDPPTATLQSWWHWMHEDDVGLARNQLDDIRSGASERYQCEVRMRTTGGRTLWVLDHGSS